MPAVQQPLACPPPLPECRVQRSKVMLEGTSCHYQHSVVPADSTPSLVPKPLAQCLLYSSHWPALPPSLSAESKDQRSCSKGRAVITSTAWCLLIPACIITTLYGCVYIMFALCTCRCAIALFYVDVDTCHVNCLHRIVLCRCRCMPCKLLA